MFKAKDSSLQHFPNPNFQVPLFRPLPLWNLGLPPQQSKPFSMGDTLSCLFHRGLGSKRLSSAGKTRRASPLWRTTGMLCFKSMSVGQPGGTLGCVRLGGREFLAQQTPGEEPIILNISVTQGSGVQSPQVSSALWAQASLPVSLSFRVIEDNVGYGAKALEILSSSNNPYFYKTETVVHP